MSKVHQLRPHICGDEVRKADLLLTELSHLKLFMLKLNRQREVFLTLEVFECEQHQLLRTQGKILPPTISLEPLRDGVMDFCRAHETKIMRQLRALGVKP